MLCLKQKRHWGYLAAFVDIAACHKLGLGWGGLLEAENQKSGLLLNISSACTGHPTPRSEADPKGKSTAVRKPLNDGPLQSGQH